MKIAAIIYSRLGSRRLKNKALIKIGTKSLLEHVINNTKKIKSLDKIILATTKLKQDKKLIEVAKKNKISYFQGHETNVLKRTLDCLKKHNYKYFLRVCGDRIFFDHNRINKIINSIKKKKNKFDLVSSNKNKKVDQGLTIEIVSISGILKIFKLNKKISNYDQEHITNNFYKYKKKYNLENINLPKDFFLNLKYTIDEKIDVKRAKFILRNNNYKKFSEIIKKNLEWERNEKKII